MALELANVKKRYVGKIQTTKYLCGQFASSPTTVKIPILCHAKICLSISVEPCETFVSLVKRVSRSYVIFIMFQNLSTKLHNLELAIVLKIRNQEIETEKVII